MTENELPSIIENKVFWNVPCQPGHIYGREENMVLRNVEKQIYDNYKKRDDGTFIKSITRKRYFDKYNGYFIIDDTKVETPDKKYIFKKKFRLPCHSLLLTSQLDEIKVLPKELIILYVYGSEMLFKFPVSAIPLNLVSLTLRYVNFPFNGKDLSHLKSLRILVADFSAAQTIPILPKDIEYVNFQHTALGNGFGKGVEGFTLKNHKRLKYLNVKDSQFTKKRKNIPKEWELAKTNKLLDIWW